MGFEKSILNTIAEPITIISKEHKVIYANRSFEKIFGKNPLNKDIKMVFHANLIEGNLMNNIDKAINGVETKDEFQTGFSYDFPYYMIAKFYPYRENVEIIGAVILFEDITIKAAADHQLNIFLYDYLVLFDFISDPIYVIDRNRTILEVNKSGADILKMTQRKVLHQKCYDLFPCSSNGICDECDIFSRNDLNYYSLNISLDDGRHFLVKYNLITQEGKDEKMMIRFQDITDLKNIEIELNREKEKAEKANMSKNEFLANMSHELRTPLNGIIGFSDILTKLEDDKEKIEMIGDINYAGKSLLRIVEDLLSLSRIEIGNLKILERNFKLKETLIFIYNNYKNMATLNNVDFEIFYDDQIPEYIFGDDKKLQQVIFNLLSNSFKFTSKGSVTFRIDLLEKKDDECNINFIVEDTGIGIEKKNLKNIYESFYQEESYLNKNFSGAGLGLTITKKIIDYFDGEINIESEKNIGTKITFSLRFKIVSRNNFKNQSQINYSKRKHLSILLVEDYAISQAIIKSIAKKNSWKLTIVSNGKKALEVLKEKKDSVDLILMDIQMPVMNGFECTSEIRGMDIDIPIIGYSAYTRESDVKKSYSLGMNGYIKKPSGVDTIVKEIESVYNEFIEKGSECFAKENNS